MPFVVTPDSVTQAMLEIARVGPGDHVIDLGPGFPVISTSDLLSGGGVTLGYFLGMMAFEMLVYVGVRKCRYAARVREASPPAFAPAPATT